MPTSPKSTLPAPTWASPAARYDVYLDQGGATLLAKAERVREARSDTGSRLVAANLESSTLQRVSKERLGSLRARFEAGDFRVEGKNALELFRAVLERCHAEERGLGSG